LYAGTVGRETIMAKTDIIRIFVSSSYKDLQPERNEVEKLLQRFKDTKFIGMEYFGSRDDTTYQASLAEVEKSDLYLGIIGGRFGSGITEAEYMKAHDIGRTCLIYIKREEAISIDGWDPEPGKREHLIEFKKLLKDSIKGHLITEFSNPFELASRIAADLHNWLFDHYFSPAINEAATGKLSEEKTLALGDDLQNLIKINQELLAQVATEKMHKERQLEVTLEAFIHTTYDLRNALIDKPEMRDFRKRMIHVNIDLLGRLYDLNAGRDDVFRELATNYRALAEILMEEGDMEGALSAYKTSAERCQTLVTLRTHEPLYYRDLAVSHFNIGIILQNQGNYREAEKEYLASLPSAEEAAILAAELDPVRYSELIAEVEDIERQVEIARLLFKKSKKTKKIKR
jgi:hypothetical protein